MDEFVLFAGLGLLGSLVITALPKFDPLGIWDRTDTLLGLMLKIFTGGRSGRRDLYWQLVIYQLAYLCFLTVVIFAVF